MEDVKRFRGTGTEYIEIGQRGEEKIGLGISYAVHPNGTGMLIARFVASSENGQFQGFKVFVDRYSDQFRVLDADGHDTDQKFIGVRLNKVAIPLFYPPPHPMYVGPMMEHFKVWPVIAGWITEQLATDGFTVSVKDLEGVLKMLLGFKIPDPEQVKMVLEFPDLVAYHQKKQQKKAHKSAPHAELESDPDDDPDPDDDSVN